MNTPSQLLEITPSYGWLLVLVLLPVVNIGLAIVATIRHVRRGERGLPLILWLLYIWLIPFIGPLVALFTGRRPVTS